VAILDARGSVTVVEVPSGRVVSPLIRHPSTLTWVQWDPAGGRILTMGDGDEVLIWDIQHGTQAPISLRSPGSTVMRARWSPDGRFVVTIGIDRRVRVWDAVKAELVAPPIAHAGAVAFAVMTAGQRLISASYADPHVFRAWDLRESSLAPDVLGDYAKMLSGRRLGDSGALVTLTPEELVGVHRSLRACAPDLFD
jgi:WD40 repeat protein